MSEPRWLSEADVTAALDLPAAIDAVRGVLTMQAAGDAMTLEKTAVTWGGGHTLHALGGVAAGLHVVGTKTWAHTEGGASPLLVLWEERTGELLAVVEAFALGQLRTAAVSAVATDALAAPGADVMAMVGTGKQALAQVAAVLAVRPLREIRVHSPTPAHRAAFCSAVQRAKPALTVVDCGSVAEALAGAAVVTTATRSRAPMVERTALEAQTHVNALGAITPGRCELDPKLALDAAIVVSDSPEAARSLSDEVAEAPSVVALAAVASGWTRTDDGPTLFKAMGLGLADVALGAAVLRGAEGAGTPLPPRTRSAPRLFGEERP